MSDPTKILYYDLDKDVQDLLNEGKKVSDIEKHIKNMDFLTMERERTEEFEYAEEHGSKDVVKHTISGERPVEVEYEYDLIEIGSGANTTQEKAIVKSIHNQFNKEGKRIEIEKKYSYDDDGDITKIVTTIVVDEISPGEVTSLTFTPLLSSVEIDWLNPTDDDFSHVNIYEITDEQELILAGKAIGNSHTLTGLTSNKEYTFVLKTVDTSENESDGESFTVTVL